ncbi:MAG: DUF554 domain-containing protein [Treponema sp.]|jgi:uncharacterized membrane protein YqgA involved in biofilm formation|nr:DUF554 domain-containing protein [Treponema sp.]
MIAVYVNCFAVLFGALLGIVFSDKITDKFSAVIRTAAGLVVIVIGLQSASRYQNVIYLTLALILGGLLGSWWNLDGLILRFGTFLERVVGIIKKKSVSKELKAEGCHEKKRNSEWNFSYAFLNSSLLFCVGTMSILGSIQAGINKDYTIIFTKSVLDGFMAVSFAAAMGPGTFFSAIIIFVYQGLLTLLAALVKPFITDQLLREISASGGVLIMMIGINLLGLKKIKTANFLPSLVLTVLFVLGGQYVRNLFFV